MERCAKTQEIGKEKYEYDAHDLVVQRGAEVRG